MTRYHRIGCLLLCFLPLVCAAAEVVQLNEQAYRRARILADEGDLRAALPLLFKLMREAPDRNVREEARERLETLGLSSQEIFKLDLAALPAAEMEKLCARVAFAAAARRRQAADLEYAQNLLQSCILTRIGVNGEAGVDVNQQDLNTALDHLLKVALSEADSEPVRSAQSILQRIGISGATIDVARRGIAEDKLPPEIVNKIVVRVCLRRLDEYREQHESKGQDDHTLIRRQVAKEMGLALTKYLLKTNAQSPLLLEQPEVMEYWRAVNVPDRADQRF